MLTFVAQLRLCTLFAISSVKQWLVSFGSLWTVQSPSILDVSLPSVSMFEQIDRLSFPRQRRVGGLIWLPGRINSCWKSVRFQGTTGHSRRRGKAHLSLACVCSLQQRSLFLVKDYILFSLGYPQLKKKSPWWVNELPCWAYWIICLVFLTKWEALTALSWGVEKCVSSW